MLLYTYKGLMILYKQSQVSTLKNLIKKYNDLQALKEALNNNNIECY